MISDFYELACLSLDHCLEKSTLSYTDNGYSACHTLDWRHTEVFIYGDVDHSTSTGDQCCEYFIARSSEWIDIRVSLGEGEESIFFWIIDPIGEYEILIWHSTKCFYHDIYALGWGES
jgi:hypothetical protein